MFRKEPKIKTIVEVRMYYIIYYILYYILYLMYYIFLASIFCAKMPSILRVFAWLFRRNKSVFICEVR